MTAKQAKAALPFVLGAITAGVLGYSFDLMTGETAFMVAAIGSFTGFLSTRMGPKQSAD